MKRFFFVYEKPQNEIPKKMMVGLRWVVVRFLENRFLWVENVFLLVMGRFYGLW
jgi:hypothetical protein